MHIAAAVAFAQNHPSMAAETNRVDEVLTTAPKQALALVDSDTLDHLIVGGSDITSFAERDLI